MHHIHIVLFTLLIMTLGAQTNATTLYPINVIKQHYDEDGSLEKGKGYLFIKLALAGEGTSIHYKKIDGFRKKERPKKMPIRIPLGSYENGYHTIPFETGTYQITRVDAPHYNLPFYIHNDQIAPWQFTIKEGHLNYIGQLTIEKERGIRHVEINLYNRYAQDYQEIQAEVAPLKGIYPLIVNFAYRDDFQKTYREVISLEQVK